MNREAVDTREKILEVASHLFAKFGYDGTSIRDIASQAEVNVAAVNYHFTNKPTLYWQIYERAHQRLTEEMQQLAQPEVGYVEFCLKTFDLMFRSGDMVKNTFKLILSDSVPEPEGELRGFCSDPSRVGPPGGEILLAVIERELGAETCRAGKVWAVRVLFSSIAHWSLMLSTSYFGKICKVNPELSPQRIRHLIQLNAEATLAFLKAHGADEEKFSQAAPAASRK